MDIDANLAEMLTIADRIVTGAATGEDSLRLADLVGALDGWLSAGGFLPHNWARNRRY
jgi:hypothetical protein